MRIVGVIAEYNPFHLGHAHQLREARNMAKADAVVVVMSSCFTQRGEAALVSPRDRAEMALRCGADAVFALPVTWAVRDAEHFALSGVALLAGLGCDAISFGTETADVSLLRRVAEAIERPGEALTAALQAELATGVPYPAALAAAVERAVPGGKALLDAPNSTLAVCYMRAMLRLGVNMGMCPVPRTSGYHETALGEAFPSATALRGAILRGDWVGARRAMPDAAWGVLERAAREGRIHRPEALDAALLHRLRQGCAMLPDESEGIGDRLHAAAMRTTTREALLQAAKTRRYPYARLSRMATHGLLGITDAMLAAEEVPGAAWLLGLRRESRGLFAHFKARGTLPIISKAADFANADAPWFRAELLAYDAWSLGAGLPGDLGLTQGVVNV